MNYIMQLCFSGSFSLVQSSWSLQNLSAKQYFTNNNCRSSLHGIFMKCLCEKTFLAQSLATSARQAISNSPSFKKSNLKISNADRYISNQDFIKRLTQRLLQPLERFPLTPMVFRLGPRCLQSYCAQQNQFIQIAIIHLDSVFPVEDSGLTSKTLFEEHSSKSCHQE